MEREVWLKQMYFSDISSILKDIVQSIGIDKIRIKNLDNIEVPEKLKRSIVKEFKESVEKINPKFSDIYEDLIRLYSLYFSNIELMDKYMEYPPTSRFVLYPYEMNTISEFLKYHWFVNLLIYKAGLEEKEYAEKRLGFRVNYTIDFVPTYNTFFSDLINNADNLDQAKEMGERGRLLYWLLLGSEKAFRNLKEKSKTFEKRHFRVLEKWMFENYPFRVLLLDNVIEEIWHVSGIIMLDLGFYATLMKFFDKNSVEELIKHLDKKREKVKYPIPHYLQNYDSCGVVCLLNAAKYYYPKLNLNEKMEREFLKKVQYKEYPGNLAPLMSVVAKEMLNLKTDVFFDFKRYLERIKDEELIRSIARRLNVEEEKIKEVSNYFLEILNKIGYLEKSDWDPEEVIQLLDKGSMIIFCKDFGELLHYNLVFGYDKEDFYLFDPLFGEYRIKKENIRETIKNKFGTWGLITYPPNLEIIEKMKNNTYICKKVVEKYGVNIG